MFLSKRLVQSSVDAIGTRCTYVILKQRILYMFFLVLPVFFSAHCILALYAWKMHNNGVKAKTKASRARKLHKPSECLCRKFAQGRKIINPSGGYPPDFDTHWPKTGSRRSLATIRRRSGGYPVYPPEGFMIFRPRTSGGGKAIGAQQNVIFYGRETQTNGRTDKVIWRGLVAPKNNKLFLVPIVVLLFLTSMIYFSFNPYLTPVSLNLSGIYSLSLFPGSFKDYEPRGHVEESHKVWELVILDVY